MCKWIIYFTSHRVIHQKFNISDEQSEKQQYIQGGRFRATLHHFHWLYAPFQCRWFNKAPNLPFIKQTQNSSQALINPQSRKKKKKSIIYSSQSTERKTDVEIKCFTQDHRAARSREGMKVLHTNPTSLLLTQTRERKETGDNWGAAWQPGRRRDGKTLGMELRQKQDKSPEHRKSGHIHYTVRLKKWDNGSSVWKD